MKIITNRLLAYLIDLIIISIIAFTLAIILYHHLSKTEFINRIYALSIMIHFIYFCLLYKILSGLTVGGLLLKIKVVELSGRNISLLMIIARTLFLTLGFWSITTFICYRLLIALLNIIGVFGVSMWLLLNKKHQTGIYQQTIWDLVSRTKVIRYK